MKSTVFINSVLYNSLYKVGGDNLIAVYSILNAAKNGNYIIKADKSKRYGNLHKKTKLSIKTLKKYIPFLIEMELCNFSKNGDFYMMGVNKIAQKYKTKKRQKFGGIDIDTFTKTKLNSFKVRVYSMEQRQKNRIDKRYEEQKVMSKVEGRIRVSENDMKLYLSLVKKGITLDNYEDFSEKVVLSVCGFGLLKSGERDKLYVGQYWKEKLISGGIIKSKRNTLKLRKCSKKEFEDLRYANFDVHLSLFKGWLYEEQVASFNTI